MISSGQIANRLRDHDLETAGLQSRSWDFSADRTLAIDITGLNARSGDLMPDLLDIWSDYLDISFDFVRPPGFEVLFRPGSAEDADINTVPTNSIVDVTLTPETGGEITGANISNSFAAASFDGGGASLNHGILNSQIARALGLAELDRPAPAGSAQPDSSQVGLDQSVVALAPATVFGGAVEANPITPMFADLIALDRLYGLADSHEDGNTVYGKDGTAGGLVGDYMRQASGAQVVSANVEDEALLTLYDTGGIDLLDFSDSIFDQTFDLRPGQFSATVAGRPGIDTADYFLYFTIERTTVIENVRSGDGNDLITGNTARNVLEGGGGDDRIIGAAGNDQLRGDAGDDFLNGGTGVDVVRGGADNDRLIGADGADRLFGDDGKDVLIGGAGNDLLDGGRDDDTLRGNDGADVFRFRTGFGNDRVVDFEVGVDQLDFSFNRDVDSLADLSVSMLGANLRLETDRGDVLTLRNVSEAALSDIDVLF